MKKTNPCYPSKKTKVGFILFLSFMFLWFYFTANYIIGNGGICNQTVIKDAEICPDYLNSTIIYCCITTMDQYGNYFLCPPDNCKDITKEYNLIYPPYAKQTEDAKIGFLISACILFLFAIVLAIFLNCDRLNCNSNSYELLDK
jgi:hypothetical protein